MIFKAELVTASEAAYILQKHLGSMKQWSDFLSDNIRHKQNIKGYTLTPCTRLQGPSGYKPAYSLADIKAFIQAVKAADPSAGRPIRPVTVQLDTTRGWRVTKFDRKGNPAARHGGTIHAYSESRFTTI